jgi:hypothetical protein
VGKSTEDYYSRVGKTLIRTNKKSKRLGIKPRTLI